MSESHTISFFFFFNDTATTEIYTLSLHDALPISIDPVLVADQVAWSFTPREGLGNLLRDPFGRRVRCYVDPDKLSTDRSEEHTSELQSQSNLVCRLLLEKKKKYIDYTTYVVIAF